MIKQNVLQKVRTLFLTVDNKVGLASRYAQVTIHEKNVFEQGLGQYHGRVNEAFREKLFDRFVYSLFAKDPRDGQTMYDYLLSTETGFSEKKPSSFIL